MLIEVIALGLFFFHSLLSSLGVFCKLYRVIQKKYSNTKVTVFQKYVKNFVSNFAQLFKTKLHLSVLLRTVFSSLKSSDVNANFKNEFHN